jgi:hypothetical protein
MQYIFENSQVLLELECHQIVDMKWNEPTNSAKNEWYKKK